MKAAVIIIFLGGVFLTVWIAFCVVRYFFGARIKLMWQEHLRMVEANHLQKKLEEQRLLKLLELNKVLEVEAIAEGVKTWDMVRNGERCEPVTIVLDITNTNKLVLKE